MDGSLEEDRKRRGQARHRAQPVAVGAAQAVLIELIAAEPDLTLEEIRVRLRSERKQKAGIGSIWRFFDRHDITFKKNIARRRAGSA